MKLTNEICISFLRGSGWLYNHDKEITISERNKAIDDFLREIKIDVIATTFGLRICDAERIAKQLKVKEK